MHTASNYHQEFAKRYRERNKQTGHLYFEECLMCGNLEWKNTYTKELDGFTVTPANNACQYCQEINARAPEIFRWVLGVIGKLKRDGEKKWPQD